MVAVRSLDLNLLQNSSSPVAYIILLLCYFTMMVGKSVGPGVFLGRSIPCRPPATCFMCFGRPYASLASF